MKSIVDYLEILELNNLPKISVDDINNKFRQLSKKYHPDVTAINSYKDGNMFIEIKEARDYILSNLIFVNKYLENLEANRDKRTDKEYVYDTAVEYFKEEKYEEAYNLFDLLKEFKDSHSYKVKSQAHIIYDRYTMAQELYNQNKYADALHIFNTIKGYEDVNDIIEECKIKADLELKYNDAQDLLESESYMEAYDAFKAISGYKDSKEKASYAYKTYNQVINFDKAVDYFVNEKYEEALRLFELIGKDYLNVSEYIERTKDLLFKQTTYNDSLNLINEENYNEALVNLKKITPYKDSETLILKYEQQINTYLEDNYKNAVFFLNKGEYINAFVCLERCMDYKDADELYKENRSNYQNDLILNEIKEDLKKFRELEPKFSNNITISKLDKAIKKADRISAFKDGKIIGNELKIIREKFVKHSLKILINVSLVITLILILVIIILSIINSIN